MFIKYKWLYYVTVTAINGNDSLKYNKNNNIK